MPPPVLPAPPVDPNGRQTQASGWLQQPDGQWAAHYYIREAGQIYQFYFIDEHYVALADGFGLPDDAPIEDAAHIWLDQQIAAFKNRGAAISATAQELAKHPYPDQFRASVLKSVRRKNRETRTYEPTSDPDQVAFLRQLDGS